MVALVQATFDLLVDTQVTYVQGKNAQLVDMRPGSILRAVLESNAAIGLWLESNILLVLQAIRASTAVGPDLDSWMADFGLVRLAAQPSFGIVTFARFTATSQAVVTVGALVQTADNSQRFAVIADNTNPQFSVINQNYTLPVGMASLGILVQAVNSGIQGNVSAHQINSLVAPITFIDTVDNGLAFTTGVNAESDAAFRIRFINYINSLSKATPQAIRYALSTLSAGVKYTLVENKNLDGSQHLGYFYAVVDDGTGSPSTAFLTAAYNAVDAVRPTSITFGIFAPGTLGVVVVMTISTLAGYVHATVAAAVATAITAYINSLAIGQTFAYERLRAVAYSIGGVDQVLTATINGGVVDVVPAGNVVIEPTSVTVS